MIISFLTDDQPIDQVRGGSIFSREEGKKFFRHSLHSTQIIEINKLLE